MLKAVRFEETEHAHFLKYIEEYRNSKGKPNDSEAIRFLMQVGYDSLNSQQPDLEQIKSDIINQVVNALSNKMPEQQVIDVDSIKKDIAKDLNKKRKNPPSINIEALKKELMEELKKEMQLQPNIIIPNNQDAMTLLLSKLIDKLDNSSQSVSTPNHAALDMILSRLEQIPKTEVSNTPQEKTKTVRAIKENAVEIPPDTNSLLANMIGNANR